MTDYQELFLRYVAELRGARAAATAWWTALESAERKKFRTVKEAKASLQERWPFGPMSHPWVLGIYRKYFLLTCELNDRGSGERPQLAASSAREAHWGVDDFEADGDRVSVDAFDDMSQVAPWVLLIDSLHGVDKKLADAMAWIVYQPIGMDADDKPV
jgi:hypothetical protein